MARKRDRFYRPQLEALEGRELLTASVFRQGSILRIEGSSAADRVVVASNGNRIIVSQPADGIPNQSFAASSMDLIVFRGRDGDDAFINNSFISALAIGGRGRDLLQSEQAVDRFFGGAGVDRLFGDVADLLEGGPGVDRVVRRQSFLGLNGFNGFTNLNGFSNGAFGLSPTIIPSLTGTPVLSSFVTGLPTTTTPGLAGLPTTSNLGSLAATSSSLSGLNANLQLAGGLFTQANTTASLSTLSGGFATSAVPLGSLTPGTNIATSTTPGLLSLTNPLAGTASALTPTVTGTALTPTF